MHTGYLESTYHVGTCVVQVPLGTQTTTKDPKRENTFYEIRVRCIRDMLLCCFFLVYLRVTANSTRTRGVCIPAGNFCICAYPVCRKRRTGGARPSEDDFERPAATSPLPLTAEKFLFPKLLRSFTISIFFLYLGVHS